VRITTETIEVTDHTPAGRPLKIIRPPEKKLKLLPAI
jgi:hypothetical protein